MTILEALRWGEGKIKSTLSEKKTNLHHPKLDSQVLLAHALHKSVTYLISHMADELSPTVLETFERSVKRRTRHEPVAYITGEKEFYGRKFFVNPSVLIPRPDTEHLIEEALRYTSDGTLVFDVGTGSGAIAVTIAAESGLPVIAIDISPQILAIARHNAEKQGVEQKISFLQGNLLTPYFSKHIDASNEPRAIILANLPYLPMKDAETLDPDVVAYEPKEALFSGVDGLDAYHALVAQIAEHRQELPKKTLLIFEIDPSQEQLLPGLIREALPSANIEVLYDYANHPRIVVARI